MNSQKQDWMRIGIVKRRFKLKKKREMGITRNSDSVRTRLPEILKRGQGLRT